MGKRLFNIELHSAVTVELDDAVINAVDGDWRSSLYNLHTAEEIAGHVGYNLVVNGVGLSSMDGWADQNDDNARLLSSVHWQTKAREVGDE